MAHWVHDGASYFEIDGALVKHKPDPQEKNPSNAMWVDGDGVSSGSHYWKINFATLEGVSGFGLTSKERFKRGFECNGLMLIHGDLCHGGPDGCLVKGFGPRSEEGNTVGIVARFDDKNLNVYFDVNGKSLGAAFVTPKTIFTSIFPMVRFFSEGSATCTKQTEIPKILKRPVPDTSGIEGEWKLKMLKENDVEAKIVVSITCKIEKREENIYDWIITASKSFRTKLIWVNGKLETTPIISDTRILAPTGQKFESSLKELMHDVNTVENNDGFLYANSETLESTWRRNDPTFKPFNGNPFGRRV